MSSLIIRRMAADDIDPVFALEQDIFKDAWSRESFVTDVNSAQSYPFVALNDDEIIGYAVCWYYAEELHIGNIAVAADQRNKGFGGKILNHIFGQFAEFEVAFLEVRESNAPAVAMYEKFGFKKSYIRKRYYSDGEDAIVMMKTNQKPED